MQTNKQKYRALSANETSIPLFNQPWYLDIVCGQNNWNVAIVEKNNQLLAAWPYLKGQKFGISYILNPKRATRMGLWIKKLDGGFAKQFGSQKKITAELLEQLPNANIIIQCFNYDYDNWLPLYWKGYKQSTRYSYFLKYSNEITHALDQFSSDAKRFLKKSQAILTIQSNLEPEKFKHLLIDTFKRQHITIDFSKDKIMEIVDFAIKKGIGDIIYAIDDHNNIHSALFYVISGNTLTMIAEGNAPEFRGSNAKYLITHHVMQLALDKKLNIDFEAGMIEPIEHVYRQFGGELRPYHQISYFKNKLFELLWTLKK